MSSQTVVVMAQPQPQLCPGQPQDIREWTTELCGCFDDCTGCMFCFFCHPCFMCMLASSMNECTVGPLCCGAPFEIAMRTKLRAQYGIRGTILNDSCLVIFCGMCAMHQMQRELKNMGRC